MAHVIESKHIIDMSQAAVAHWIRRWHSSLIPSWVWVRCPHSSLSKNLFKYQKSLLMWVRCPQNWLIKRQYHLHHIFRGDTTFQLTNLRTFAQTMTDAMQVGGRSLAPILLSWQIVISFNAPTSVSAVCSWGATQWNTIPEEARSVSSFRASTCLVQPLLSPVHVSKFTSSLRMSFLASV